MGFRIYHLIILVSASSILFFSMETTSVHGHPRCKRHRHHKDCSSSSSSDARKNCCCCLERKSKMCPAESTTSAIPLVTNPGVDIFRPSSIQRSSFISLYQIIQLRNFSRKTLFANNRICDKNSVFIQQTSLVHLLQLL